jgi:hypothetical protein
MTGSSQPARVARGRSRLGGQVQCRRSRATILALTPALPRRPQASDEMPLWGQP